MLDFGAYFTDALIEASFVRTPAAGFCHAGFYTFSWLANVLVWTRVGIVARLRTGCGCSRGGRAASARA
tara:strand:+ start:883 stop:1089 length:207 start_codon:yes stop_codon:yes gene_type:complete